MYQHKSEPTVRLRSSSLASPHTVSLSEALFEIESGEPIQFIDLTDLINDHLSESGIESGEVTVFSRHTTAAIKINEAEELLLEDFKLMLGRLCPVEHRYHHNDMSRRKPPIAPDERANAHSHCMHLLLSTSETIPVADARLALGTWQRVFMVELDGPRKREVHVRFASYRPHEGAHVLDFARANGARTNGSGAGATKWLRDRLPWPMRAG